MNRTRRPLALAFVALSLLIAVIAWAGPRPKATVPVIGTATAACYTATGGAALIAQCPSSIVWYRSFTDAEAAGYFDDGGVFGVLADFTNNTDPIGVKLATNETTICFKGTDAGLIVERLYELDGGSNPADGGTLLDDGGSTTRNDAGTARCFLSVP